MVDLVVVEYNGEEHISHARMEGWLRKVHTGHEIEAEELGSDGAVDDRGEEESEGVDIEGAERLNEPRSSEAATLGAPQRVHIGRLSLALGGLLKLHTLHTHALFVPLVTVCVFSSVPDGPRDRVTFEEDERKPA